MILGPDLPRVVAAFNAEGARHVVIGGFAVVAHQYVRATEDVDLLVPDDPANDARVVAALARLGARKRDGSAIEPADVGGARAPARRAATPGLVDLLRAGVAPLDFDSVDADAIEAVVDDVPIRVCGLASSSPSSAWRTAHATGWTSRSWRRGTAGSCRACGCRGSTTTSSSDRPARYSSTTSVSPSFTA